MPSPERGDPAAARRVAVELELELPLGGAPPYPGAAPFDLEAAVCSHGLFMMAPNRWDPASRALVRPLRLAIDRAASVAVRVSRHPARPSDALLVSVLGAPGDALSPPDQTSILEQVRRMLRLDEEDGRAAAEFQAMHAVAREAGFGRIFRSPTLFEDMVKCILLCNCQWTRTLSMSTALCELQLELRSSSSTENFQSRTPPIRECKRKRSNKRNVRVKLETKFNKDKLVCLEDPNLATDTANLQTYENSFNLPSAASGTGNTSEVSLDHSELKLRNEPCLEDCGGDFPTPEELANLDEDFLAKRCNLGYRARRIVMLARSIVEGKICLQKLEEIRKMSVPTVEGLSTTPSTYDRLNEELSTISGFGPFTRANVLMCMGFFHMIPADTETIRHLKQFHKRASTISSVQKELDNIYGKYAPFQFLAYWCELWGFYNKQFGKISDMEPINYRIFTAKTIDY
uniref:HhH-GPD domain-containing protein n=1 Tax=Oryza glumipatula TaxID=40148 RepID=A0A0E0ANR1_9ORYZ